MKVSRERLQIIGKMIGILREEKRQNKQNSWTQIRFCENICSPNTLKSIESGKVGRSDAIYEQLLAKLDLKYGEFPVIDEGIEKLVEDLHKAIEFYNIEEIKNLTIKGMKVLENAKEYVYYSDLYKLMQDINLYYDKDYIITEKETEHYLKLLKMVTEKTSDIIKILSFSGIMRKCLCDIDSYKEYIKTMEIKQSDFSCLKLVLLNYYHKLDERLKMVNLINELEEELIERENYIRLIDTYNSAIILMTDMDKNLVNVYISKVLQLLDKYNLTIPISKKSETYANIADSYHSRKDYINALNYLEKSVTEGCENLVINFILIADCQNHLGIPINIKKLDKDYVKKFPKEIRVMYNYFLSYNGDEVPPLIKQKILMKRIAPLLQDRVLIDIFDFELKKLVKITNSYKDLLIFDELIRGNAKSENTN